MLGLCDSQKVLNTGSRAHRGLWPHRRPLHLPRTPSFRLPPSSKARGGALGAGGGRVGFAGRAASSRLLSRPWGAVGSPGLRLLLRLLIRPRFRPSQRGRAGVSLGLDGCEVRLCDLCVRVCACVSLVCPGSPRCLFTPVSFYPGPVSGFFSQAKFSFRHRGHRTFTGKVFISTPRTSPSDRRTHGTQRHTGTHSPRCLFTGVHTGANSTPLEGPFHRQRTFRHRGHLSQAPDRYGGDWTQCCDT